MHKEFIWDSKRPNVKDHREGGLNDIDTDAKFRSLKFLWIKRLKDSNFLPWKAIACYVLLPVGKDNIYLVEIYFFQMQTDSKKLP